MPKIVLTGKVVQERLLEGAKILYDAVSTTLGPNGLNALIESYDSPIMTHDGVTVARYVDTDNEHEPGVKLGIQLIKKSSERTNELVGDGTTSSTVVTYHLMRSGYDLLLTGKNAMKLRKELTLAAEDALVILKELKTDISEKKDIVNVATLSAEDEEIGKVVGELFYKLGKDALVTIENGELGITSSTVDGYEFEKSVELPFMLSSPSIDDVSLALLATEATLENMGEVIATVYDNGDKNLVIIAPAFNQKLLSFALTESDNLSIICIKSPGHGDAKLGLLEDLGAITSTKISQGKVKLEDLGKIKKITMTANRTIILANKAPKDYIDKLVNAAKEASTYDKSRVEERIKRLQAKVGVIKSGSVTEFEAKEREYLIEDSIAATRAAMNGGIVPGGAVTYLEISNKLSESTDGHKLLKDALKQPFKLLMTNAGERSGVKSQEIKSFGQGFDITNPEVLVDMIKEGFIDPAQVVKEVITGACNIAGMALTTGVIITDVKEKDEDESNI